MPLPPQCEQALIEAGADATVDTISKDPFTRTNNIAVVIDPVNTLTRLHATHS